MRNDSSHLNGEGPEFAAAMHLYQTLRGANFAVVQLQLIISNEVLLELFGAIVDGVGQLLQSRTAIFCVVPAYH